MSRQPQQTEPTGSTQPAQPTQQEQSLHQTLSLDETTEVAAQTTSASASAPGTQTSEYVSDRTFEESLNGMLDILGLGGLISGEQTDSKDTSSASDSKDADPKADPKSEAADSHDKLISMDEEDEPADQTEVDSKLISMDEKEEPASGPRHSGINDFIAAITKASPELTQYIDLRDKYTQKVESSEIQARLSDTRVKLKNLLETTLMSLAPKTEDPAVLAQRRLQAINTLKEAFVSEQMRKFEADLKGIYGESALQEVQQARRKYRIAAVAANVGAPAQQPAPTTTAPAIPTVTNTASTTTETTTAPTAEAKALTPEQARIENLSIEQKRAEVKEKKSAKAAELERTAQAEAESKYAEQEAAEAKAKEAKAGGGVDERPKEEYEHLKFLIQKNIELKKRAAEAAILDAKGGPKELKETKEQEHARLVAESEAMCTEVRELMAHIVWYLTLNPAILGYDYSPWDVLGSDLRYLNALPSSIILGYLGCDIETIAAQFDPSLRQEVAEWLNRNKSKTEEILKDVRKKFLADASIKPLIEQIQEMEKQFPGIKSEFDLKLYNEEVAPILAAQAQMKDSGWIVTYVPWDKFVEYTSDKRFSGFGLNLEGSGKFFPGKLSSEDLKKRYQLHQGGYLCLWSGGMAAPMCLIRQNAEPDVIYPKDAQEYSLKLKAWVGEREANSVGFFFSPERQIWEAHLVVETDGVKNVVKVDIGKDSAFLPLLKTFSHHDDFMKAMDPFLTRDPAHIVEEYCGFEKFSKKKLKHALRNNVLFEGRPMGSQWLRAIVAFGAKYNQYQAFVKAKTRYIRCMNWDLDVQYPNNAEQFNAILESWKQTNEPNAALFIYNPTKNAWVSYLIKNAAKELEERDITADSPLMAQLRGVNAGNVSSFDKYRFNHLLLEQQSQGHAPFTSYTKVLKVGNFQETVTGRVEMRSVTEESLFNINTTVNDTLPMPTATVLRPGSRIICDSDQDEEWFDFILLNEKSQFATYNHREYTDGDIRVRHSGDKYIHGGKPAEAAAKREKGLRNTRSMRQHIVMWPREKGPEASHTLILSASYSSQMTKEKRRADIFVSRPNEEQDTRLAREMDEEVKNSTTLRKEEYEIVDELTRDHDPACSVPSVEPFAESGAWGVLMASVYYSPRHQCSFLIKWNMPLTFQVTASSFGDAQRLMKEDLQRVIDSPEFQAYLDHLYQQDLKDQYKDVAPELSDPLTTIHYKAVNLAIKLGKEQDNLSKLQASLSKEPRDEKLQAEYANLLQEHEESQKEYTRLYKILSPLVPVQDLVSILNSKGAPSPSAQPVAQKTKVKHKSVRFGFSSDQKESKDQANKDKEDKSDKSDKADKADKADAGAGTASALFSARPAAASSTTATSHTTQQSGDSSRQDSDSEAQAQGLM